MKKRTFRAKSVQFLDTYSTVTVPIEVKAGTNSHLRAPHSFVNLNKQPVTAVRVWSGNYFVQEAHTPAPDNRPYTLINVPFYYVGQLISILGKNIPQSPNNN